MSLGFKQSFINSNNYDGSSINDFNDVLNIIDILNAFEFLSKYLLIISIIKSIKFVLFHHNKH